MLLQPDLEAWSLNSTDLPTFSWTRQDLEVSTSVEISRRTSKHRRSLSIILEDTLKCSVDSSPSSSRLSLSRTVITPSMSTLCLHLPLSHLLWASPGLLRSQPFNSHALNRMLECTKRTILEFKITYTPVGWEDLILATSANEVDQCLLPLTSLCCTRPCHPSIYNNLRRSSCLIKVSGSLFHKIPCKVPLDPTFTSTRHLVTTWICDRFRSLQQQVKRQSLPAQASLAQAQIRLQCLLQTSALLIACHTSPPRQ